VLAGAKRRVLTNILASEFTVLTRLLARIAAGHYSTRDYSPERLRAALEAFMLIFRSIAPTLRRPASPRRPRDHRSRDRAPARAEWFGADTDIFDFLRDALTLDLVAPGRSGHSIRRVRRFAFKTQQFTGPMMAKSMERHRLLPLSPAVGAE
jgi:(1->4)-alpha-D-glucan 1-alpha-D-glucosylmutase